MDGFAITVGDAGDAIGGAAGGIEYRGDGCFDDGWIVLMDGEQIEDVASGKTRASVLELLGQDLGRLLDANLPAMKGQKPGIELR